MIIDETLRQFARLLEDRFSRHVFTTEDSIRYTFFYCLSNLGNLPPSDIILESPHTSIPKAEVDTYIPAKNGRQGLVLEFKFDRAIPSGKNAPRPQKAGKVFADIMRLALFSSSNNDQRYLIYVTDREMADYFQNESNQLNDFFNLNLQNTLRIDDSYIQRHCKTFVDSIGEPMIPCKIICRLSEEFKTGESLRVYEIHRIS